MYQQSRTPLTQQGYAAVTIFSEKRFHQQLEIGKSFKFISQQNRNYYSSEEKTHGVNTIPISAQEEEKTNHNS